MKSTIGEIRKRRKQRKKHEARRFSVDGFSETGTKPTRSGTAQRRPGELSIRRRRVFAPSVPPRDDNVFRRKMYFGTDEPFPRFGETAADGFSDYRGGCVGFPAVPDDSRVARAHTRSPVIGAAARNNSRTFLFLGPRTFRGGRARVGGWRTPDRPMGGRAQKPGQTLSKARRTRARTHTHMYIRAAGV